MEGLEGRPEEKDHGHRHLQRGDAAAHAEVGGVGQLRHPAGERDVGGEHRREFSCAGVLVLGGGDDAGGDRPLGGKGVDAREHVSQDQAGGRVGGHHGLSLRCGSTGPVKRQPSGGCPFCKDRRGRRQRRLPWAASELSAAP